MTLNPATLLTALVRTLGVLLLAVGLWAIVTVVVEAVGLYREPEGIERMVASVERAAGLGSFNTALAAGEGGGSAGRNPAQQVRPAYFIGWFMTVLLFLVVGKLADWALSGALALLAYRCRTPGGDPGA